MAGHSRAPGAAAAVLAGAAALPKNAQTRPWNVGKVKARMPLENRLAAQTTHRAMGTVMTHKAFGLYAEDSLAAVCREVARIEGLLSRFLPDSDISRVNGSAGIKSEKVSLETYDVLSRAVEFSRYYPGCV
jgi:thiamine biosynthesis lipoprotein ApbE